MIQLRNYINGELIEPVSKKYLDNYEPATGEVYSHCPDSDERDVQLAVEAARKAFPEWSNTHAGKRSEILLRIAQLITENLDTLSKAE